MMQSTLSLVLTLSLSVSAPLAAEEWPASFRLGGQAGPGPIRQAAMREAVRLAADQQSEPVPSSWSRVLELAAGTEITMTIRGGTASKRSVVAAEGSGLTVLNLDDPALPSRARRLLSGLAAKHPEFLVGATKGGTFLLDDNVRLAPNGLFVAGGKVADLGVVENVARGDVAEITRSVTVNRGPAAGGAIAGALGGFLAGFYLAAGLAYSPCHGSCTKNEWLMGLSLVGLPIAGGLLGYHALGRKADAVIYSAP